MYLPFRDAICRNHFQGGDCNAAGGKSEVSMEETVSKFEDLVTKLTI
jgi:phosphoesterase RecJ-like protein